MSSEWYIANGIAITCALVTIPNGMRGVVPGAGVEPAGAISPVDFESTAFTSFTIPAKNKKVFLTDYIL